MRIRCLAAVILSVVFVLGCIGGEEQAPSTTLPATTLQTPTTNVVVPTTLQKDVQDYQTAMAGSDVSACNKIADEKIRDLCMRDQAVKALDPKMCEDVTAASLKDTCYHKIAITNHDKSLCSKISNNFVRNACNSKA